MTTVGDECKCECECECEDEDEGITKSEEEEGKKTKGEAGGINARKGRHGNGKRSHGNDVGERVAVEKDGSCSWLQAK
jgi:hypothetical protein